MGKWVLVEFDNDTQADALCAQITAAEAKGKAFRVIGVFARPPRKRCECGSPGVDQHRTSKTKRHRKTGFYYCTVCKRVKFGRQSPRNELDDPNLPLNHWSQGKRKEADILLEPDGNRPIKNFPITEGHDNGR